MECVLTINKDQSPSCFSLSRIITDDDSALSACDLIDKQCASPDGAVCEGSACVGLRCRGSSLDLLSCKTGLVI